MKLNLLFFGSLVDIIGVSKDEMETNNLPDIESLNKHLQSLYPSLTKHKYKIAVNQKMVEGNIVLKDGDEVAFLPPFAGG